MFALSFLQSYAQEKSVIYFDEEWNKTTKDKATYYRNIPLEIKDDKVLIKDYYISGQPQMIGWADKDNEDDFIGEVRWFYENGNVNIISNYHYGNLDGEHKEFYENGNKKFTVNYEGQLKEGEGKFFNKQGILTSSVMYKNDRPYEGTTNCFATYKEGKNIERKLYYENTTQLAYEKHTAKTIVTELYYRKNGKKIREVITDLELKTQDRFKGSYYPGSKCGYVVGMRHFQNIKNGKLEGEEEFYNLDGSVLYHGINRDNNPYDGTFYRKKRGVIHVTAYKKGIKTKEKILYNSKTIAIGTYVNGKKHSGTFISEAEIHGWVCSKISTLKEGKEEGKQVFKRLKNEELLAYYYAKNGVKDGESYDYDRDNDTAYILSYTKGIPTEGKLLKDNGDVLIYKEGKLDKRKVKVKTKGITFFEIYKNDQKIGVEYTVFEIDGQITQTGTYQNNQPYQGYFLRTISDVVVLLDYYEKGIRKYQYAISNIKENTELIDIPFKSIYKNNKIHTGAQYEMINDGIRIKILEKGKINAISIWVFAMHYANNLILKKTDEGMEIVEIQNPDLKIVVGKEFISLTYKEEIIDQRKRNTTNNFINKGIAFYLEKGVLKSDISWGFSSETLEKIQSKRHEWFRSDFVLDMYSGLPPKNTIESTFKKFSRGNLGRDNKRDYISHIFYDEVGQPAKGILIEEKKELFNAKLYLQNKVKESKKSLTIDLLKEQISIWHKKYN
ncbi:hypothetical protein FOF46_22270 [Aquimarina algiphila]|uniref:Toxin-antitoxin system YwqK family antitoxin n=2 Tax=Aquimarina algiphila TaxID=2047982 RepID=A0A554VEP8_9FLAO|nr:hypothetical protein [Aquimarina algiphila]TSE05577.1 hypothetical protein FOF46_22270 [Aquimarina algiphila]